LSQCKGFCEHFIPIIYFCFTNKVYLELLKWFNWCILWLHKHHSFTLLATDLAWCLNIHKFLWRY